MAMPPQWCGAQNQKEKKKTNRLEKINVSQGAHMQQTGIVPRVFGFMIINFI